MFLARLGVLRITIDLALVAALVVLAVVGLGIGAGHPNPWAIWPGPAAVTVTAAEQCLSTKPSVAHVARTGSTGLSVTFRNGATVRLRFFRWPSTAWRLAPVNDPFLTRSSLSNVVITRPQGSTQPPHASLFALVPCLVRS